MRTRTSPAALWSAALLLVATALAVLSPTSPAAAATLQEITDFGSNPGNNRMFLYVPDGIGPRPAVLVGLHWCSGTGPDFYHGTQYRYLADQYKFIVIYPSANRSSNCWDVASTASLTHNGGSDSLGVVSMVKWVEQQYNADPDRTYVTGHSSGGMMTNVLLGAYPDVFEAGSASAGVPYGCFAGPTEWNSTCSTGNLIKTPQEWGDLVRAAYPGYTGPRPRMQLFHGTDDDALRFQNFEESIKQWTDVHGLSQTPTTTEPDTPRPNWTRTRYADSAGVVKVEAVRGEGEPHNIPILADEVIRFFGLDTTAGPSPSPSVSPSPSPSVSPSSSPSVSPSPSPSVSPSPSPSPSPSGGPAPAACRVDYQVNAWNTGLTTNITITNLGAVSTDGWTLTFTLPAGQTIVSGWNATYTPASGAVTARNMSYNGTIPVHGSTSIGFQATHTGDSGKPVGFSLNGFPCATA